MAGFELAMAWLWLYGFAFVFLDVYFPWPSNDPWDSGDPFGGGSGDPFGGGGGFGWDIGIVIAVVWGALLSALADLWAGLQGRFNAIGDEQTGIWAKVLKPILLAIPNLIIAIHLWLEDHLAGVLKFLKRVRDFIDRMWKAYIAPILKLIQRIRQVLVILRLLHIKWAQTLDTYLQKIQSDITRVFLTIRGTLNAMIDVVNVLTGAPTLRRMVAGAVVTRRTIAGICRIYTGLPIGWFFPNPHPDAPAWEKPVTHSSQLLDPARNPLAGTLFGAFDPLAVSDFIAADPTPTDADLALIDPNPYFVMAFNYLVQQEQRWDSFEPGVRSLRLALEANLGVVADSGNAWASSTVAMLGV